MTTQDIICRLNELPESILFSNIISRLSLIDAVRSSILCRKWRFLWTKIPHLHFSSDFFRYLLVHRKKENGINFRETMEHILMQHDAPLESFIFHNSLMSLVPASANAFERIDINTDIEQSIHHAAASDNAFKRTDINIDIEQSIHHAAKKGVKKMLLKVHMRMNLPVTVFAFNALQHLELSGFVIPEIPKPTASENFALLKTCCLRNIENLNDKSLEGLVELCPLLQKLVLLRCEELIDLKLQAANLNCLILLGCSCVQSLTADCPQLCRLKIGSFISSLAEVQINSYNSVEIKVWDCYSLSKMQMNSCVFLQEVGLLETLSIEGHSSIGSLRKLSLTRRPSSRFLGSIGVEGFSSTSTLVGIFPELEELKVFAYMMVTFFFFRSFEIVLSRQMFSFIHIKQSFFVWQGTAVVREEKMEVISDLMFPNLKKATLYISSQGSEEDVAVLDFILRNSPSLSSLIVNRPFCFEDFDEPVEFKNLLLSLERAHEEVNIKVVNEGDEEVKIKVVNEGDEEEYYVEREDDSRFWNDVDDHEFAQLW